MRHKIFMWKTPTNCENKKSRDIRPINRNPLFEVKSHRFTLPFYPKNLLSSIYNLIHIHNVTTTCCFLVDHSVPPKGLQSSTNNSKN